MNNNYPKPMVAMHWVTFLLVLLVYFTSGNPIKTGIVGQIHVLGGILVFILFFIRVILVFIYKDNIPKNRMINAYQIILFKIVKITLYLSLCCVPILGWLALSSLTDSFSAWSINIPLWTEVSGDHFIAELHQILANVFMTLVGLHACAALIHHFVFKDGILKSMLLRNK
jgi:cytochrome b561